MPREDVQACLERILASPDFAASDRNRRFLAHVVNSELDGRDEDISSYNIAVRIFGRSPDFDPTRDPIVRIEAGKLRRDLEMYYLKSGRAERVVISLPRGGYWPHFALRDVSASPDGESSDALDPRGITVHVLHSEQSRLANEYPDFRARVVDALARLPDLAVFTSQGAAQEGVLLDSDTARDLARKNGTKFVLSGCARDGFDQIVLTARLHDGDNGRQIWSEDIQGDGQGLMEALVSRLTEVHRSFCGNRR
ncbi:MAG: hypothetical protein FGM15_07030 [Chthoniobacterales bacterium]|nr:hypothetical protein [Chthoniobacterales bacterium]